MLGFGGAWIVLSHKPASPPVLLHPTSRQLAQAENHIAGVGQAVSGTGRNPRTLRLSENDLNVYLAGSPPARKLLAAHGVQAVQIVLVEPAGLIIHAAVRIRSHSQNIQIGGALAPDPKTGLRFTATQVRIGRFPLPPSVVTAEANALAARFLRRLPMNVQNVCVQKNDLVIVGLPMKASPQSKSPGRR